jgi:hypothetical protein
VVGPAHQVEVAREPRAGHDLAGQLLRLRRRGGEAHPVLPQPPQQRGDAGEHRRDRGRDRVVRGAVRDDRRCRLLLRQAELGESGLERWAHELAQPRGVRHREADFGDGRGQVFDDRCCRVDEGAVDVEEDGAH